MEFINQIIEFAQWVVANVGWYALAAIGAAIVIMFPVNFGLKQLDKLKDKTKFDIVTLRKSISFLICFPISLGTYVGTAWLLGIHIDFAPQLLNAILVMGLATSLTYEVLNRTLIAFVKIPVNTLISAVKGGKNKVSKLVEDTVNDATAGINDNLINESSLNELVKLATKEWLKIKGGARLDALANDGSGYIDTIAKVIADNPSNSSKTAGDYLKEYIEFYKNKNKA